MQQSPKNEHWKANLYRELFTNVQKTKYIRLGLTRRMVNVGADTAYIAVSVAERPKGLVLRAGPKIH